MVVNVDVAATWVINGEGVKVVKADDGREFSGGVVLLIEDGLIATKIRDFTPDLKAILKRRS